MELVFFPSVTVTAGLSVQRDWEDFANHYLNVHVPQLVKDGELYAGAIYESGNIRRGDAHVIGRTAVVFDVDNKNCDITLPEDHVTNLDGLTWAWHSTWSSRPEHPKFRIIIPLDRVASPQEWPAVYRGALALLGNDPAIDSGSADLSRAYYRPAYHPNYKSEIFAGFRPGSPLSVDAMIESGGGVNVVTFQRPSPPYPVLVPPVHKVHFDGRNDALKAQVAACIGKGKGIDDTVREVLEYDARNHTTPLFTDPAENRALDAYTNAVRFVSSIIGSVNSRRIAQGQPPETPQPDTQDEPLPIFRASTLADRPAPKRTWLIEDWIPMAQTTALYGTGGVGKTLLAQQIMTAAATGRDFFGLPVKCGPVLGVFCEDSTDELHLRQSGINAAQGIHWRDLADMNMLSRVGEDNLYITFEREHGDGGITSFWRQVMAACRDIHPVLLVTDTAADTFGGNENNRSQVRQYIQRCLTHIAIETGCAHLLCAHPSVSGLNSTNDATRGGGGSTAWNNSVRSRLYLYEDEDKVLCLERVKSNYAKRGESIQMIWVNGVLQSPATCGFIPDPLHQCMRDFLSVLDIMSEQGREVSNSKHGSYAPRIFVQAGQIHGFKWALRQYETAMEHLFKDQKIRLSDRRSDKRTTHIVRFETSKI